jgi:hypothetical protein
MQLSLVRSGMEDENTKNGFGCIKLCKETQTLCHHVRVSGGGNWGVGGYAVRAVKSPSSSSKKSPFCSFCRKLELENQS